MTSDKGTIFIQAHRGAGAAQPENTLESCVDTWSRSTLLIPELDISTTVDGVIVAFHDKNLRRMVCNLPTEWGDKSVHDLTWEQARQLDVGGSMGRQFQGRYIAQIADAFTLMAGHPERRLYLDYKHASLEALAKLVYEFGVQRQVILATNQHELAKEWKRRVPESGTLLWISSWGPESIPKKVQRVRDAGFQGLAQIQVHTEVTEAGDFIPTAAFIDELAKECQARDIVLQSFPFAQHFGGYCHPDAYRKLLELGVTSFATDYPLDALQAVNAYQAGQRLGAAKPATTINTFDPRRVNASSDTWSVTIGSDVLQRVDACFHQAFGRRGGMIVADENTWEAAGRFAQARLSAYHNMASPLIFPRTPILYAEMSRVKQVQEALATQDVTPIAVGSGTINDLVKLAAHRLTRPYMVIATAASMDGYTAFGASITYEGSKQTFDCPAPRALLVDMGVIAQAPSALASAGYADLLAKVPAGADWILADALEIEPINDAAWQLAQANLRDWLSRPELVTRGDISALQHLMDGLVNSGLAMQVTRNSRPASGVEHQFSHLWDMQGHRHDGCIVPHGSKVALGALASSALAHALLEIPLDRLDITTCCRQWPTLEQVKKEIEQRYTVAALREKAMEESVAKYITVGQLQMRLERIRQIWPELRQKLQHQLLAMHKLVAMLKAAGAPTTPEEIGLTREQLRLSYFQARMIRRRYTLFDLAAETGHFAPLVENLFASGGLWSPR